MLRRLRRKTAAIADESTLTEQGIRRRSRDQLFHLLQRSRITSGAHTVAFGEQSCAFLHSDLLIVIDLLSIPTHWMISCVVYNAQSGDNAEAVEQVQDTMSKSIHLLRFENLLVLCQFLPARVLQSLTQFETQLERYLQVAEEVQHILLQASERQSFVERGRQWIKRIFLQCTVRNKFP